MKLNKLYYRQSRTRKKKTHTKYYFSSHNKGKIIHKKKTNKHTFSIVNSIHCEKNYIPVTRIEIILFFIYFFNYYHGSMIFSPSTEFPFHFFYFILHRFTLVSIFYYYFHRPKTKSYSLFFPETC